MNRRVVLIFSGVLALLAVILMQLYRTNLAKELGVHGERVKVLAAKADIPEFTVMERSMLKVKEYPKSFLPPRYVSVSLADDIVGETTLFRIRKDAPILTTDLASTQSEASLSRIITPGMRALALPVDRVNTFGGLLAPKDHVDILGTFQKPGEGDVETVTLLQNVAILAVGGRLGSGRDAGKKSGKGANARSETVTALVTPEEAELLVFAQDRGTLSLTMRNEEDVNTEMELDGKNFADIFRVEERKRIQTVRTKIIKEAPVAGINIIGGGKRTGGRKRP